MTLFFQTPGYEELELSTQIVIAEALKRGVEVEVLDAQSQMIRLKKGNHSEIVESATKTSRDSYITSIILGNKAVAKIILTEHGLLVPRGKSYTNIETAKADFSFFKEESIVVKPKTTNYGIGITILHQGFNVDEYAKALGLAFSHDTSVLVEEFIPGLECRFLVVDGQCIAVMHRIPANVIGDGLHTIAELVEIKNADSRRGKGYITPLEKIELGEVELSILSQQNLKLSDVPSPDKQIFLRKNSNISTGGDSIDFSDFVHSDFKEIAVKASAAVNAKICGVDIICPDFSTAATNDYAIIELNYNPALHLHDFPYKGKNQNTAKWILNLLDF